MIAGSTLRATRVAPIAHSDAAWSARLDAPTPPETPEWLGDLHAGSATAVKED